MTGTARFGLVGDCRDEVGYAIQSARFQFVIVCKCKQLRVRDMADTFQIIREFTPQLIDRAYYSLVSR